MDKNSMREMQGGTIMEILIAVLIGIPVINAIHEWGDRLTDRWVEDKE